MEWISINEKLPKFNEEILVYNGNSVMLMSLSEIKQISDNKKIIIFKDFEGESSDISYWMLLPKLPINK